jgi:phage-related protein
MTLATFVPFRAPRDGTLDSPKFKILKADFGDGYTQWTREGINTVRRSLSLSWEDMTPTQAKSLTDFFNDQGGVSPFYWTPSDETVALKWTCDNYTDKRGQGGLRTVTATFDQSFNQTP